MHSRGWLHPPDAHAAGPPTAVAIHRRRCLPRSLVKVQKKKMKSSPRHSNCHPYERQDDNAANDPPGDGRQKTLLRSSKFQTHSLHSERYQRTKPHVDANTALSPRRRPGGGGMGAMLEGTERDAPRGVSAASGRCARRWRARPRCIPIRPGRWHSAPVPETTLSLMRIRL